jgi:uncharacterized protein
VLYVDSSALIKRYLDEIGSDALNNKVQKTARAGLQILTSVLSYAEIHAVLARRLKEQLLRVTEYHSAVTRFDSDWRKSLARVELSQSVLDFVPDLVKRHPLKGADAIQLASALWAARAIQMGSAGKAQTPVGFATSDKQLAAAAEYEQLEVFNPKMHPLR